MKILYMLLDRYDLWRFHIAAKAAGVDAFRPKATIALRLRLDYPHEHIDGDVL